MKRNELHIKKFAVKKNEKIRLKQIKEMMKNYAFILLELLISIHDSKIVWKTTNFIWIAEKAKKTARKNKNMSMKTKIINTIIDEKKNKNIIINVDEK